MANKIRIVVLPEERSWRRAEDGEAEWNLPGEAFDVELSAGRHQVTLYEYGWCVGTDDAETNVIDQYEIEVA